MRVWDLNSGQEDARCRGDGAGVNALALTGDGRVVSGSYAGIVTVWDLNSGHEERTLPGHFHWVNALAFTGMVESSPAHPMAR